MDAEQRSRGAVRPRIGRHALRELERAGHRQNADAGGGPASTWKPGASSHRCGAAEAPEPRGGCTPARLRCAPPRWRPSEAEAPASGAATGPRIGARAPPLPLSAGGKRAASPERCGCASAWRRCVVGRWCAERGSRSRRSAKSDRSDRRTGRAGGRRRVSRLPAMSDQVMSSAAGTSCPGSAGRRPPRIGRHPAAATCGAT